MKTDAQKRAQAKYRQKKAHRKTVEFFDTETDLLQRLAEVKEQGEGMGKYKEEDRIMAKYIIANEKQIGTLDYTGNKTDAEVLAMMQANEPDAKWTECKKVPEDKHVCKYCGNIADGTHTDLLCAECREAFGHTLYSEL